MQQEAGIVLFKRKAYRQALYDLDPVAGGVFRWQQRKGETGAGAETDDLGRELDPRIGVDFDRCRLARAHVGELGFLEVRLDPDAVGDDREDRGRGGNVGPDLKLLDLGDDAVFVGADSGVG